MLTSSPSSSSIACCCAASQAVSLASFAVSLAMLPLEDQNAAQCISRVLEPERAAKAKGNGGSVFLWQPPGIGGHGDLGDRQHRPGRVEQEIGELGNRTGIADGPGLLQAKGLADGGKVCPVAG